MLVSIYKVANQTKDGFVAVKLYSLVRIVDGVIILESIAFLVFQEDTRHMTGGEGVMVAIGRQITTMQTSEVMLLIVYLLKELIATHTLLAALAVLNWTVIPNHIYIEKILYLAQGHNGIVGKEL